jgi:hypothetical protein
LYRGLVHLNIPDVRIDNFNPEQKLAFDIVVKTVLDHERNDEGFKPLRMVVTGTDGSGKSYLIKGQDCEKFDVPAIPHRHMNSIHPNVVAPIGDLSSINKTFKFLQFSC